MGVRRGLATNIEVRVDRTADGGAPPQPGPGDDGSPKGNWVALAAAPAAGSTLDLTRRDQGVLVTDNKLDMTMMYAIHGAFRRDLDRLTVMAEKRDPDRPVVTRGWETLKLALDGHHHAEDQDLWPIARRHLQGRDDDLLVLDAMEAEHGTIDPLIREVDAQVYATDVDDGALAQSVASFRDGLTAHLAHEERDALPVLNRSVSQQEWQAFGEQQGKRYGLRATATLLPWITEDADAPTAERVLSDMPLPMRLLNQWIFAPRYRNQPRW